MLKLVTVPRFSRFYAALAAVVVLAALRFVHLEADFPLDISTSRDLYTDEGAYAGGAVNYFLRGSWRVEGDLNPAVRMPMPHLMQAVAFGLFGRGLGVARGTVATCFIAIVILSFYFLRGSVGTPAALLAAALLTSNYYLFAYSRFANNEMPMTLWLMLSVVVAFKLSQRMGWAKAPLVALLFTFALLAKTTALLGVPVLVFGLWRTAASPRMRWSSVVLFLGVTAVLVVAYQALARHFYGEDYAYYSGLIYERLPLNPLEYLKNVSRTLGKPMITDPILYPLAFLGAIYAYWKVVPLRRDAAFVAAVLWGLGYLLLVNVSTYQPARYAVPYAVAQAWVGGILAVRFYRAYHPSRKALLAPGVFGLIIAMNVVRTGLYLASPQYSLMQMAEAVREEVHGTGGPEAVLLGTPSANVALAAGVRALNSEFGAKPIEWRLAVYRPSHFLTLEDDPTMDAMIALGITVEKAGEYDVFENYNTGRPLSLYRLHYPEGFGTP